jgi:Zn-dependent protease with chaperone function
MAHFFLDPVKVGIILVSFTVSIASLLFLIWKKGSFEKKIPLIYLHLFALIFPFLFYMFATGCEFLFRSCSTTRSLLTIIMIVVLTTIIATSIIAPILFFVKYVRKSNRLSRGLLHEMAARKSLLLGIKKPHVYLLNDAEPTAFAFSKFKKSIFISAGLADLLSKKELEAVVIHELAHIRNDSSMVKFSTFMLKALSPFATFMTFHDELNHEERKADALAVKVQGTRRYLKSAKMKIEDFYRKKEEL